MNGQRRQQNIFIQQYGGWVAIGVACALPLIRLLMLQADSLQLTDWYSIFTFLGKAAGLVGFVLYAINLLLSVRKRWLEKYFNGLNRVYIAHHVVGGIALILLIFHPLFLAVRYIEIGVVTSFKAAAQALVPSFIHTGESFAQVQNELARNNGFIAFTGMVVLLILTFFIKLPYRIWLFTHKFLGPAFFFATLHVLFIESNVSRDPFLKTYILIWAVIGLTAFTYRTLFGSVFVRNYPFQVSKVVKLPNNVIAIDMKALEDAMPFTAGQFVFVRFKWQKHRGILPEFHPFSIASSPKEGVVRLCVKALGDYTKSLMELPLGTIAEVEGAFGKFNYERFKDSDQIWIAGGIGITPFLSMASSLGPDAPSISLFYSVNKKDELIGHNVFESVVTTQAKKFTYIPFVKDEMNNKFIDAGFIKSKTDLANKEIFLCGPPPMMKSMRKQLKKMGVPGIKIHSEEFAMS